MVPSAGAKAKATRGSPAGAKKDFGHELAGIWGRWAAKRAPSNVVPTRTRVVLKGSKSHTTRHDSSPKRDVLVASQICSGRIRGTSVVVGLVIMDWSELSVVVMVRERSLRSNAPKKSKLHLGYATQSLTSGGGTWDLCFSIKAIVSC
jgi:hypothetical protein